jgi:hypothetical protein
MDLKTFIEWQRSQGHKIVKTNTMDWVEVSPAIYQAIPYHQLFVPQENEFTLLFKKYGAIGLRYSTPVQSDYGSISYHTIYQGPPYSLNSLSKKARHDISRGLKMSVVEPISLERLATEGWELRHDTLVRQGRVDAETQTWWETLCRSAIELPGFEAWGAIIEGRLVAALLAFTCDNCCSILYQQSRTEFLPFGVNNALTFIFTNEVLKRPCLPWLFYGLHSLDAPASVDEFKFRMGYTAHLVRQRVVFNPLVAPLFNPLTHSLVKKLCKFRPGNPILTKAEGMIRFYLQGKRPLAQQDWPENLINQRESFLAGESIQS